MQILQEGQGQLIGWHDPDENRQWVLENKPRDLHDKRTTVAEAVARFVHDGDFVASGGFGHVRVGMAAIYEIIRQRRRAPGPGRQDRGPRWRSPDRLRVRGSRRGGLLLRP